MYHLNKKMMKSNLLKRVWIALSVVACLAFAIPQLNGQTKSIYDYTVETIDGKKFKMSELKEKKIIIVNVASKCGFTNQYESLQALYEKYSDKGLVIIGFPANNFGAQEPGKNEEIKSFCSLTYGVTFPMMAKISAKGDDIAPIYEWLTSKKLNGVGDYEVSWNFNKFLINADGTLHKHYGPRVTPNDEEIIKWLENK